MTHSRDRSSTTAAAAEFWRWFQANAERLAPGAQQPDELMDELGAALERVEEGLTFELEADRQGHNELVISADGRRELFSTVVALVGAAPAIPGWTVVPFRQPRGTQFVVEAAGHSLSPDDIWFRSEPDGPLVGITLYVRGLTDEIEPFVRGVSFLLLDAALGEYTMETRVGFVEWELLPPNPAAHGLHPFHELPQLVSQWVISA